MSSWLPDARDRQPSATPGATIGPYRLLARVGEGGMGVVHLAAREDGEQVALKVLRPHIVGDDEARARLAREVASLGRVRSRWVAEIVDADPWAEVPYVATRYVPGLSLHDHVAQEGPMAGRDLLWAAGCLAEGLAAVHAVGVLHRDVKPSNVLLEGRTPILIDFGLARVADDLRLTHTGWLLGTPGYLAPEILYGDDATTASDVHSWAATVAYAATGTPPFGRGPAMAVMDRVRRGEHDVGGVPAPLRGVLVAALDTEPLRRPSLGEVLTWLRPLSTRPHDPAVPPPPGSAPTSSVAASAAAGPSPGSAPGPTPGPLEPPSTRSLTVVRPSHAPRPGDLAQPSAPPRVARPAPGPALADDHDATDVHDAHDATDATDARDGAGERAEPSVVWEPWVSTAPSTAQRARASVLSLALGLLVATTVAFAPWVALALVLLTVWLLRAGSLALEAVAGRRARRGARWHDGPRMLLSAPLALLRAVPGTILLALVGLVAAAGSALVVQGALADPALALGVGGATLAGVAWWGPSGPRLRSPVGRLTRPLARRPVPWLVALLAVLALSGGLALSAAAGPDWRPVGRPGPVPLSSGALPVAR